jgi:outer membrane protein TolC
LPALILLFEQGVARAEPVRLEELERRALSQRSSLAAASFRTSSARAQVAVARAPYSPTLAATVDGEMAPGGRLVRVADVEGDEYLVTGSRALGDPGVFTPDFRYGGALSFNSRLYDFGRTGSTVRAARAELAATTLQARAEQRSIVLDVRDAYVTWLAAFGVRDILHKSAEDARALRGLEEARVAEGTQPGARASSARYDEARAELELERAAAGLELARLALERAIGGKLSSTEEPDFALLDLPASRDPAASPEADALERRSDALAAAADAHRAGSLPVLSANVDLGLRAQGGTAFPLYRLGLALSIPLLDGGLESASADQARSQASELSSLAREARASASLVNQQGQVVAERAAREIVLARRLVEVAEQSLQHAKDQRELDGGSQLIVQARLQRSRAELELFAARVARARAVLALRAEARP